MGIKQSRSRVGHYCVRDERMNGSSEGWALLESAAPGGVELGSTRICWDPRPDAILILLSGRRRP